MHTNVIAGEIWGWPTDAFAAWGQWAGAVGSVLAVGVALWLARGEGRRYRAERLDRDAAQARTVVATVQLRARLGYVVIVENHGTLPVLDVVIDHLQARLRREGRHVSWEMGGFSDGSFPCRLLPGGESVKSTQLWVSADEVDGITEWPGSGPLRKPDKFFDVTCSFYDANGLRWRREGANPPVRVVA